MSWVWDANRAHTTAWPENARKSRDALSQFSSRVDMLFYASAAAFAVCVVTLLIT